MKKIILSVSLLLAVATAFATTQTKSTEDKPWRVFLLSDAQNLDATTHYQDEVYENANGEFEADDDDSSSENQTWINYNHAWLAGLGGAGSEYNNWQNDYWDWQGTNSGSAGGMTGNMVWDWSGLGAEVGSSNDGTTTTGFTNTLWIFDKIGNEHCNVSDPVNQKWDNDNLDGEDDGDRGSQHDTYTRTADTIWHVQTGGKAVPGLLNLCQFSGSAWEIVDKRAVPQFYGASMSEITNKPDIAIGCMGNLMTNGVRYNLLPNDVELDVTPKVAGKDFYTFNVSGEKYCSYFEVFVNQPEPGTQITYSDTAGHAFFRFYSDGPDEVLQSIHPELLPFENNNWGFYPQGGEFWGTTNGYLADDSHPHPHGENVSRIFYIGYPQFIAGLTYTKKLKDTPPLYSCAVTSWGYSCVYAARVAGFWAGITLPSDLRDVLPQNFGADILMQFPGPPDDYTPRYSN